MRVGIASDHGGFDRKPEFIPLAQAVRAGSVGASACANKIPEIRAAPIHDHYCALQGVADDHRNQLFWNRKRLTACAKPRPRRRKRSGLPEKKISTGRSLKWSQTYVGKSASGVVVSWRRKVSRNEKGSHKQFKAGQGARP